LASLRTHPDGLMGMERDRGIRLPSKGITGISREGRDALRTNSNRAGQSPTGDGV